MRSDNHSEGVIQPLARQFLVLGADHRPARVGRGQVDDQGEPSGRSAVILPSANPCVETLPVAFLPGAGIRRVVELRRGDRDLRVDRGRRLAAGDGEVPEPGKGLPPFSTLSTKSPISFGAHPWGCPCGIRTCTLSVRGPFTSRYDFR